VLGRHALRDADPAGLPEPRVDDVVEEVGRLRPGLQRLAVDLVEQPLVRRERGVGQVPPHGPRHLGGRHRRVDLELGEGLALLFLHRPDHLDEQALLRPEVVDEHAVARADLGREAEQACLRLARAGDPPPEGVGRDPRVPARPDDGPGSDPGARPQPAHQVLVVFEPPGS
jgi:hypothetical protein